MCLGELYSSKGKLSSLSTNIKTTNQVAKDVLLNTSGKPVLLHVGGWVLFGWIARKLWMTMQSIITNKHRSCMYTLPGLSVPERLSKIPMQQGGACSCTRGSRWRRAESWEIRKHHLVSYTRACARDAIQLLRVTTNNVLVNPCFFCLRSMV